MNIPEIAFLGLALAVDATVYSFSYGLILKERRFSASFWLALTVGFYQAMMPLIGYAGGETIRSWIGTWAPWIIFSIFTSLGIHILYQAWLSREQEQKITCRPMSFWSLMGIGIATSIDALAVGICMALGDIGGEDMTRSQVMLAVSLIGLITLLCSMAAFHGAQLFHRLPTRLLETGAGVLLLALGIRAGLA